MTYFPGAEVGVEVGGGAQFTAKPVGSNAALRASNYGVSTFTPDVGGRYVVTGSIGTQTVEVATLLCRKVAGSGPTYQEHAKVFIFIAAGIVVASTVPRGKQVTPRMDAEKQMGKLAAQDAGVLAALAAMVGKTAAQITSTYWPALVVAWENALQNPSTPPGEDEGAVDLIAEGWEKQ